MRKIINRVRRKNLKAGIPENNKFKITYPVIKPQVDRSANDSQPDVKADALNVKTTGLVSFIRKSTTMDNRK